MNVLYSKARVRKGDLNHPTFEQALRAALNVRIDGGSLSTDASRRRFDEAPEYGTIVMNHVTPLDRAVFLEIVRFAPGSHIPLIRTGAGGKEYALQNAPTPDGTELARGFLYALVQGNHFVYVNREFAMNRNEMFLEWMLKTRTNTSTPDLSLSFEPEVNVEQLPSVGRMVLRPREAADTGVHRAAVYEEEAPRAPTAVTRVVDGSRPAHTRAASERLSGSSVFGILRAAQFSDERIASLEAQGVDIEIKVEVFFKADGSRHELAREDVAELIRGVPEDEITLYSGAGREKSGRIRRVAYPAQVETVGDLFDRPSISAALWEAIRYFQRQGYIG
ncbi:hypothetical protein R1A27_08540 [Methylobacterium sp. NMS12]|uniref:hypothetical protein n=1 Tax=Methylobacterium sp. NMS12 TaxID=3079766 RepID=UPI003F883FAE